MAVRTAMCNFNRKSAENCPWCLQFQSEKRGKLPLVGLQNDRGRALRDHVTNALIRGKVFAHLQSKNWNLVAIYVAYRSSLLRVAQQICQKLTQQQGQFARPEGSKMRGQLH